MKYLSLLLLLAVATCLPAQCTAPADDDFTAAFAELLLNSTIEVGETLTFCAEARLDIGVGSLGLSGTVGLTTNVDPYPFSGTVRNVTTNVTQVQSSFGDAATIMQFQTYEITLTGEEVGTANIAFTQSGSSTPIFVVPITVVEATFPVTWVAPLTATPNGKLMEFNWSVQDQVDVAGYELQRSYGAEWVTVGTVPVVDREGEIHYHATDLRQPVSSYYRIRQTDFDGTTDYSNMIQVEPEVTSWTVYPNPAHGHVQYATSGGEREDFTLYHVSGQVVRSFPDRPAVGTLNLHGLAAGTYLLRSRKHGSVRRVVVR